MIVFDFDEQGTESWLAKREPLYTGSGADKILSGSDQLKVINGAVSMYATAGRSNFKGNYYTKRGHILEDKAIELYEAIKGITGIRSPEGKKVGMVTNSNYPGCAYSPDDIHPTHTVEVKCFNETKHLEMFNGNIPLKVQAQCHYGMLICGVRACHLVIYNPDFAKKEIGGVPNPRYNPSLALKIIVIKWNSNIANNFRAKLKGNDGSKNLQILR